MKETKFIEQNKEKWLKFEQLLRLNNRDPDQLSKLFIQITDDLSYARTHYHNRTIRLYLNNLAQQLFYKIYKNKKATGNKFMRFWKEDLPSVVFHSRYELIISLVVFLLSVGIGILSSIHDPEFARTILGNDYVEMTLSNIEAGDPMGVYKTQNESDMLYAITLNNVLVAFRTFVTGILFSLGAIIIIMYNGIMVGTFQYFFIARDLGMESFLSIWLHGTLEISSIIIAGGAGIVLGRGFIFPGTHSRFRAFQLSARRGLKLLVGIVPILIAAAIIESFLTRYTELPAVVKLLLIVASLFFMVTYFVYIPYVKYKNNTITPADGVSLQSRNVAVPKLEGSIRKVNQVFRDTILIYQQIAGKYLKSVLLLIIPYFVLISFFLYSHAQHEMIFINSLFFKKVAVLVNYEEYILLLPINVVYAGFLMYFVYKHSSTYLHLQFTLMRGVLYTFITALLINLPFLLPGWLTFIILAIGVPYLLGAVFVALNQKVSVGQAISKTMILYKQSMGRVVGLYALLCFIGLAFALIIDTPFMTLYMQFVRDNFMLDAETTYYMGLVLNGVTIVFAMSAVMPIFVIGFGILYYTLIEITDAAALKQRILEFNKI